MQLYFKIMKPSGFKNLHKSFLRRTETKKKNY